MVQIPIETKKEDGLNEELEMEDDDNDDSLEGPRDVGGFTVLGEYKAREKAVVSGRDF